MRPFEHTGDSANIAFYRQTNAHPNVDYLWCEVLHDGLEKVDGRWQARRRPVYHFTIYRASQNPKYRGEVARFTYEPKRKPKTATLSDAWVTRLIRENIFTDRIGPLLPRGALS